MKACTLLESQNKNKYLYDRKIKRVHLCHPLLHYIINLAKQSKDLEQWFNNLDEEAAVEIEESGLFSKKEVEYYYWKYLFLKENGYFGEVFQEKKLGTQLNEEKLKRILANGKQVVFEVTEKCQLNCYYCFYGDFYQYDGKRERRDLDTRSAKTLLNYLLELWNSPLNRSHDKNIYISFYGGEPLLNFPFIAEIVDYVKQLNARHNRFAFSMTSNGILVEKYMDFLYSNNFELLISLDGNEDHNAYRVLLNGEPAYNAILKSVKALREKYPDYFQKKVDFLSLLHNKNSVSEIYNFFKKSFDKKPDINELKTMGIKESQKETFWKTYGNVYESLHQSEDYSLIAMDMFLKTPEVHKVNQFLAYRNDFSFKSYKDLIYAGIERSIIPTATCLPFSRKIYLTVNGQILPCERIDNKYALGTVTPDKVELDFAGIAERYNSYYDKMRKHCNVCFNTETCEQCIFNLNIEDDNPSCNGFMTESGHSKYLSSMVTYIENKPGTYSKLVKEAFID